LKRIKIENNNKKNKKNLDPKVVIYFLFLKLVFFVGEEYQYEKYG
jgi:hypothetical protein